MSIYKNSIRFVIIIMLISISKQARVDLAHYSTYKRIDLYHQTAHYPGQFCSHFVCKRSGLSEVRVHQIISKENEVRSEYANEKNISNLYAVAWKMKFAEFARRKNQLCLYPTSRDSVIFETDVIKEWFGDSDISKTLALEVVIAQKSKQIDDTDVLNLYDRIEDEITEYFDTSNFNYPIALNRRGATRHMGCDYLVRNNGTHINMHFVCAYGLLYFSNMLTNDYIPRTGEACSKCHYFDTRPFLAPVASIANWACSPEYPFLCTDLGTDTVTSIDQFLYNCDGEPTTTSLIPTIAFTLITPHHHGLATPIADNQNVIGTMPCYKYAIPLIILAVCALVILIYQIYSIIIFKRTQIRGLFENTNEKSYKSVSIAQKS